jgi:hypothetical protein
MGRYERISSLVIKIVPSVQLAENEIYVEYVYVKHFLTQEKVSEWTANKTLQAQRWVEMVFHVNRNHVPFSNVKFLNE